MDHAFMNNMNVHLLQHTLRSFCAGSSSSNANLNEKEKIKKMKMMMMKMKKKKKNRHWNGNMINEKNKAEDMKQASSSSSWVYSVFWRILPRNYPPPKYVSVCVCICSVN